MKKHIITTNIPEYGSSIKRTWETKNEFEKYDDISKYIKSTDSDIDSIIPRNLLNEFPEKLAQYQFIITNTGLVCFYDSKDSPTKLIIYDMFDSSEVGLKNINPDISMMLEYNFIDQPLNVRKINFRSDNNRSIFIPERSYEKDNEYYVFLNCDEIQYYDDTSDKFDGDEVISRACQFENVNGYFKRFREKIEYIYFYYKPIFVFKLFDLDGSEKIDSNINFITNTTTSVKMYKIYDPSTLSYINTNKYFIDLSAEDIGILSISLENCGDGYLEVI